MKRWLTYLVLGAILYAGWEILGSSSNTMRLLLSSPSLVVSYSHEHFGELIQATFVTSMEAILGLVIAIIFSFGTMIICFYQPRLMDVVLPIMVFAQVIPLIVLAPFFIILLGIGLTSKVAMAALMCFFPIFVNFAQGYRAIDRSVHELMTIYNAPLGFRIRNVYFPLSVPSIFAGLKISSTLAVIGAIVAEFNGAESGLGKNLFLSAKRLEPDLMMSSLVLASVLGYALYFSIRIIQSKIQKSTYA